MEMPLIKIEDASLFIPGEKTRKLVLNHINLQIFGHTAIYGGNGAGKSTLLRLMAGELWPASGKISWLCNSRYQTSPIAAKGITCLVSPQKQENFSRQNACLSVADFFCASAAYMQNTEEFAKTAQELLQYCGLEYLKNKSLAGLSQGELRLCLLLKAISKKPPVILLDEYEDCLDAERKQKIYEIIEQHSNIIAFIFATHRKNAIPEWVKTSLYINNGYIAQKQEQPEKQNIFIPAPSKNNAAKNSCPVIILKNVSVYIQRKLVLKNISWIIGSNEHWRIKGDNGSGKSTLLRLIAGDEFCAAGGSAQFWLQNRQIKTLDEKRKAFSLVSDLSQMLYEYDLSAQELVLTGLDNSIGIYRNYTGKEKEKAAKCLELFFNKAEMPDLQNTSIRKLSTGQLRKLFLLRALIGRPSMLLLDEPFTGLDQPSKQNCMNMLCELVNGKIKNYFPQIIIVSHYDEDIPAFVNREAKMACGTLQITA